MLVIMFNRSHVNNGNAATLQSLYAALVIMFAISLTIACSPYIYNGVILHANPVHGESHNQRNTTGEVATPGKSFK